MKYIDQLIERYPSLSVCKKDIEDAAKAMIESFKNGGKLLVAGNGGSCADSDHITGELLKSFCKKRTPSSDFINQIKAIDADTGAYLADKLQGSLPAIALTGKNGGKLKGLADICIIVPQNETFMIQELHLPVYHALCLEIEEAFWAE